MKHLILGSFFVLICTFFTSVSASSTVSHVGSYYESSSDVEAYGVDVLINSNSSTAAVYIGVNINNVTATQAIADDEKSDTQTAFVFAGVKLNLPISPYLELGKDLGDSLINDIIPADVNVMDNYITVGLTTSQKFPVGASVYYKYYTFRYSDKNDDHQSNSFGATGIRLFFRFR